MPVTARLVAIMFAAMVASALVVDALFSVAGLIPDRRPSIDSITARGIAWNYTSVLNIVFLAVGAALVALTLRRGARDPVCGMTVDRSKAVTTHYRGQTIYFCVEGCKAKFEADPERYLDPEGRAEVTVAHAGHHGHRH
jgi:YHS domain-containing protein